MRDYKVALEIFLHLAQRGDAGVQFNLGIFYDTAPHELHNEETAMQWYLQAAENGYADAAYRVAASYMAGLRGVPKDAAVGAMWYHKAAATRMESGCSRTMPRRSTGT
jgi:TPR repeat protein